MTNLHKNYMRLTKLAIERGWRYNFGKSVWVKGDEQFKTLSAVLKHENLK